MGPASAYAKGDSSLMRLFHADPGLLDGLDDSRAAEHLTTRMAVRVIHTDRGSWIVPQSIDPTTDLGLLVLTGFLARSIRLARRQSAEVVGPGDLLRPWDREEGDDSVSSTVRWRTLQPATLAVLDGGFATQVAPWPAIHAALLRRATTRSRWLLAQGAITQVRPAETRLLLLLWHLADRWGRVTPSGTVVPIPLTHRLLGEMTAMQRPTVSAALGRLLVSAAIARGPNGEWLLLSRPDARYDVGEREPMTTPFTHDRRYEGDVRPSLETTSSATASNAATSALTRNA